MHSLRYHTVLEKNQISADLLKPSRLPIKTNNNLWQIKEKTKFTWAGYSNLSRYQVKENELCVKSPKVYAFNYSKPREFLYKFALIFLSRLDKFYSNKLKVLLKFIWHFQVNNHIHYYAITLQCKLVNILPQPSPVINICLKTRILLIKHNLKKMLNYINNFAP